MRTLAFAALLLLLASALPAFASSPAIRGGSNVTGTSNGSATATLTMTCTAGDIALVAADSKRNTTPANTVSVSGGGLTWARHGSSDQFPTSAGNFNDREVWWAYDAAGMSGATVTITASSTSDAIAAIGFCVSGQNSNTAPFDPNGGIPFVTHAGDCGVGFPCGTIGTDNANDLLLGILGAPSAMTCGGPCFVPPAGWTTLDAIHDPSNTYAGIAVIYKSVSATQSAATANFGSGPSFWSLAYTAITADASAPPGGGTSAGSLGLRGVGH